MSGTYIWGDMGRTTGDPTTIDQAIGEAIDAHLSDPDAHLDVTGSLQSHRASEIIDHLAESVVNDKIARLARRYIAIVDPSSESDFDTIQDALDYAASVGGGDVFVVPGTHYISDDVYMQRTCGLYGTGDGETVILSSDSTDRTIVIRQKGVESGLYFEGLDTSTSSTAFNVDYQEDGWQSEFAGQCLFDLDGYNFIGVVEDFDDVALTGTLENNATQTLTGASGITRDGAVFVNGSNVVTIKTSDTFFDANYYVGAWIYDISTDETYRIIAHDTGYDVVIESAYSGTSGTHPCYGTDFARRTVNIEGLQLGDDNADVRIMGSPTPGTLVVTDTSIYCRDSQISITGDSRYDGCVFHFGASTTDHLLGTFLATDCVFYARESGSVGIVLSANSVLRDSKFTTSGGTFSTLFTSIGYGSTVDSCDLVISTSQTWSYSYNTITSQGSNLVNCILRYSGSSVLTFTGRHWNIYGNRFERATSGGVTLSSTCYYSIFCMNHTNGAITNSGTGNVVQNNLTTR